VTVRRTIGVVTGAAAVVGSQLVGCGGTTMTGSCTDTCQTANNGICEDGSDDPNVTGCTPGTDCSDCGGPPGGGGTGGDGGSGGNGGTAAVGCNDRCASAMNGICEDGTDPLAPALCAAGTDCTDCTRSGTGGGGGSSGGGGTGASCTDSCITALNGMCEDGSRDPSLATCRVGTDCTDCTPVGTGGGSGGLAGGTGGGMGGTAGIPGSCGTYNPSLLGVDGYIQDGVTGIYGPWYTYGCQDAVITPPEGDPALPIGDAMCFSGTVPQVIGSDYSTYYGAAIGFDLCAMLDADAMASCDAWMPPEYCVFEPESKHTVSECGISLTAVSFNITGTIPGDLRLVFKEQGRDESPYVSVPNAGGCFVGRAADATVAYDSSAPPLDLTRVESIHLQVATNTSAPVEFDFCLSELNVE